MYKNQRGQSLIQVMVAAAVGLIVMYGMVTSITNMTYGQNGVKFRMDADNFQEEVRSLLSDPNSCINSLGGLVAKTGASYNVTKLNDGSTPAPGVTKYKDGGTYGDNSLLLSKMTLDTFTAGAQAGTGQMSFHLDLLTAKKVVGVTTVSRLIQISLLFDGANKITSCLSLAKMSDGIWQRTTSNLNNIFFSSPPPGGNVGIGTANPVSSLDVAGGVRFGDSTLCDAAHEGTQRYDKAKKSMEFCDGSAWTPIGSAGKFSTSTQVCYMSLVSGSTYSCTVGCPTGEYVTGGGFDWGDIYSSAGHDLVQSGNGIKCTVNISHCSNYPPSCHSSCRAICLKVQ